MAIFKFSKSRDSKYSVDQQATFHNCHTTKKRYEANNFAITELTQISNSQVCAFQYFFGQKMV